MPARHPDAERHHAHRPAVAEDARSEPGVAYADDDHGHFALLEVRGDAHSAKLELTMVRQDGAVPYRKVFRRACR